MLSGAGRMRRPESTAIETLRDAEELEESSRITSSTRRDSVAFKCRANGISVRTLTRGGSSALLSAGVDAWPRSVEEIRIERLRPSGNATTTKAGPRPERSGKTVNRWPKSECRESVTMITHPSRSRIVSFCDVRRSRRRHCAARSASAPRGRLPDRRIELSPARTRRSAARTCSDKSQHPTRADPADAPAPRTTAKKRRRRSRHRLIAMPARLGNFTSALLGKLKSAFTELFEIGGIRSRTGEPGPRSTPRARLRGQASLVGRGRCPLKRNENRCTRRRNNRPMSGGDVLLRGGVHSRLALLREALGSDYPSDPRMRRVG